MSLDVVCCAYAALYIHDVLGNMLKEERKTNLFPEIVQLKMQHLFVVVGGKRTATHAERKREDKEMLHVAKHFQQGAAFLQPIDRWDRRRRRPPAKKLTLKCCSAVYLVPDHVSPKLLKSGERKEEQVKPGARRHTETHSLCYGDLYLVRILFKCGQCRRKKDINTEKKGLRLEIISL